MKKTILLSTHYDQNFGMSINLYQYLRGLSRYQLVFIKNLLRKSSQTNEILVDGRKIQYRLPFLVQYLGEGLYNWFLLKDLIKKDFDLAIGVDPLATFNLLYFRKRIKKLAYFSTDFSLERFNNPIPNKIYLWLDDLSYRSCDYYFALTKRALDYRKITYPHLYSKCHFVLHGIDLEQAKVFSEDKKTSDSLVFVGNLSESVDFQSLFRCLAKFKGEDRPITLDIYGDGPERKSLGRLCQGYRIDDLVRFRGFVEHKKLLRVIGGYQVGVAIYKVNERARKSYLQMGSDLTMKLVDYCAVGLPFITTRIYDDLRLIPQNKIGILLNNHSEVDKLYEAISFLLDHRNNHLYSQSARRYAQRYAYENTYQKILAISGLWGKEEFQHG